MSDALILRDAIPAFLKASGDDQVTKHLMEPGLEFQFDFKDSQMRIPSDRNGTPKYTPWFPGEITSDAFDSYVDRIGTTGWNYEVKQTKFVIFDFDAKEDNKKNKPGLEPVTMEQVVDAASGLDYVYVRHSKGGSGIHIIVVPDKPLPAATGKQHEDNARAILQRMTDDAGFPFKSHMDCGGVVGYVHPAEDHPDAFKLLVEPTGPTPDFDVVQSTVDDELTRAYTPCDLLPQHEADIQVMKKAGFVADWDVDKKWLNCHSKGFETLKRPGYTTKSSGTNPSEANAFAYPQPDGGWSVTRFGVAPSSETDCWHENKEGYATTHIEPPAGGKTVKTKKDSSPAQRLIEIARGGDLFHCPNNTAYATMPTNGHLETWPIDSAGFKTWWQYQFHKRHGSAPNSQAIKDALGVITGYACFEGQEHPVYKRVAGDLNTVYVDLCNPAWEVAKITADGWEILPTSPVKFYRMGSMLPLPRPEPGGDIDELRQYINIEDVDWPLLLGGLVSTLNPGGPYPVIVLYGEAGSAKSTTGRIIRSLVDPNVLPLRIEPRNLDDLFVAARNSWLVCYDNLSRMTQEFSDGLCVIATGGGLGKRKHHANGEEYVLRVKQPSLVAGIENVTSKGDLVDRGLTIRLPAIPNGKRRLESEFWLAFNERKPYILGALFNLVAGALREFPNIDTNGLTRMADFAAFAVASEKAGGWGVRPGTFLAAYLRSRADANESVLDTPLGNAIRQFVSVHGNWEGTATELLKGLKAECQTEFDKRDWPATAGKLSSQLDRLGQSLRDVGIEISRKRISKKKTIVISSDAVVTPSHKNPAPNDATVIPVITA